jgi:hypothetical protein
MWEGPMWEGPMWEGPMWEGLQARKPWKLLEGLQARTLSRLKPLPQKPLPQKPLQRS